MKFKLILSFLLFAQHIFAQTNTWEHLFALPDANTSAMSKVINHYDEFIVEENGDDNGPGGHSWITRFDSLGTHLNPGNTLPNVYTTLHANISNRSVNGGYYVTAIDVDSVGTKQLYVYNSSHSGAPMWKNSASAAFVSAYDILETIPTSDSGCLVSYREYLSSGTRLTMRKFSMYGDSLSHKAYQGAQFSGLNGLFHSISNRIYALQYQYILGPTNQNALVRLSEDGDSLATFPLNADSISNAKSILAETNDHCLLLLSYEINPNTQLEFPVLCKVDSMGNSLWQKKLHYLASCKIYDCHTTPDGGFIFIGNHFASPTVNLSDYNFFYKTNGNADSTFLKLNFFGNKDFRIKSVDTNKDGGFIVVGSSNYYEASYLLKTDSLGNFIPTFLNTPKLFEAENTFNLTQEAGGDKIIVDSELSGERFVLSVFSMLGEELFKHEVRKFPASFSISTLNAGMYLIRLSGTNFSQSKKMNILLH